MREQGIHVKFPQLAFLVSAILSVILLVLWVVKIAPDLKRLPDNFFYSANILSVDNLYDENAKKFQGQHISKTLFSYKIIKRYKQYDEIENKFEVSTLNDVPIISVQRIYYINPYTWQHTFVKGQQSRDGFLFGPRYAKVLEYYYWHINYNTQALLKYQNKENIDGLLVYRYQAKYSADQTDELTYLPGVPNQRGIKTNVDLEIWIEPVSGWLVKYQDNAMAYYYDKQTGKIISPWNQFSNRYTLQSVREQVEKARFLKHKILFIDYIMPALLILIAVLFFCLGFQIKIIGDALMHKCKHKLHKSKYTIFRYFILAILVGSTAMTLYYFYGKKPDMYTIGISKWSDNTDLWETIKGFKSALKSSGYKEGVNITYVIKNPDSSIENQIEILQEFLYDKVNLIFVLTTPGTLVAKGVTTKTPIVFASVIYPEETDIISTDRKRQGNLVGIRNYISPAKQFNIFEKVFINTKILGFVHHKGDPESAFQYYEFQKLLKDRDIQVVDIAAIDLEDLQVQLLRSDLNYNALYTACDTLIMGGGGKIVADFANKNKIPNFSCDKESIKNGALIGVVADPYLSGVMAGKQAALILEGARPSWLHTEAPEHGVIIINSQSVKLLGIEIPTEIVKQAENLNQENQQ